MNRSPPKTAIVAVIGLQSGFFYISITERTPVFAIFLPAFPYIEQQAIRADRLKNERMLFIDQPPPPMIIPAARPLGGNMKKSKNLYRDVVTGFCFTAGVFGFMSGEFIISTLLFGFASLTSNLDFSPSLRT